MDNYDWRVVNGSEGLTKGEIISDGNELAGFPGYFSAGNAMSNRALIYSTQAADKIRNGFNQSNTLTDDNFGY